MNIDGKLLEELAHTAGKMFFDNENTSHITVKGRSDFVTRTDVRVQEYVRQVLKKYYPEIQFMGEEKDNTEIDFNGALWILDPVDGTTNLIHDFKASALSLALCESGEITMGLIYQPFLDELFFAQKGCGAFLNGKQIHVSDTHSLSESLVCVGTSPYDRELTQRNFSDIRAVYERCIDIRRVGAASTDLAWVACGRADAYFERNLKPWDFAAGKLLIEEAGGHVLCMDADEASPIKNCDIIAGNGYVEKEILDIVNNEKPDAES